MDPSPRVPSAIMKSSGTQDQMPDLNLRDIKIVDENEILDVENLKSFRKNTLKTK